MPSGHPPHISHQIFPRSDSNRPGASFSSRRVARLVLLAVGLLLVLRPISARAHQMPYTAIMLDFGGNGVSAELILPLQELELAFKQPLAAHPEQVLPQYNTALREYLLAHVQPTAPDDRPWTVEVSDLTVQMTE